MRSYGRVDWVAPPPGLRAVTRNSFSAHFRPKKQRFQISVWLDSLFTPKPALAMAGAVALVAIVAMGVVLLSLLAQSPELTATVAGVNGLVEFQDARNREWQPLDAGTELSAGDRIRSGADGKAVLRFPDDSAAEMAANSQLAIFRLSAARRGEGQITVLHQYVGRTQYDIQPQTSDSSWFEVETSSASVKVIGTVFVVEVTEYQATLVTVDKGTVEVSGEGSTLFVEEGQVASILPQSEPAMGMPTLASNGPCIQQPKAQDQITCDDGATADGSSAFSTVFSPMLNSLGTLVAGTVDASITPTVIGQLTASASSTPLNDGTPTAYPPGTGTPSTITPTSLTPTPDGTAPAQSTPTPTSPYPYPTATPTSPPPTLPPPTAPPSQATSTPPSPPTSPPPTSPPPTSPPPTSPPPTSPPPTSPPPTSPPPTSTSPPPTSPPPTAPPPTSPPPTPTSPPPTPTPPPPTPTPPPYP